jgi:hypothetical protein
LDCIAGDKNYVSCIRETLEAYYGEKVIKYHYMPALFIFNTHFLLQPVALGGVFKVLAGSITVNI